jgi:hypothetical protein
MVGAIDTWDILAHPWVTVHCFGWRIFFRALFTGNQKTFLSLLWPGGFAPPIPAEAAQFIERCVNLELRAEQVYWELAEKFGAQQSVALFFATLATQEQEHADLLRVCESAARPGAWKLSVFNPWRELLPQLERQMDEAEKAAAAVQSPDDAFCLVVQMESSEINHVFRAILGATPSSFVRHVEAFQDAIELHVSYIVDQVSALAPHLAMATRELRATIPRP